MHGRIRNRFAAGAATAVLGLALALPLIGGAAPAAIAPLTFEPGTGTAVLARVAADRVEAAGEAAVTAEAQAAAAQAAATQAAAYTAKASRSASKRSKGSELSRARAILASLKARYPRYLSGVTVTIGSARGYQAISYYTTGKIVVSPTHRATLERILGHEIWHIIDWRDNRRIDWGERIPPANASSYR